MQGPSQPQRQQPRRCRLAPLQRIVHDNDNDNNDHRGRHLVATTYIQKGQLIFCERPMVYMQSTGNVHAGVLVCQYCMAFVGSPQQSLAVAANPECLFDITTTTTTIKQPRQKPQLPHDASLRNNDGDRDESSSSSSSSSSASPFSLILCRNFCGHVYCSLECQQDDWMWGGHAELCTGCIGGEEHDNSTNHIVKNHSTTNQEDDVLQGEDEEEDECFDEEGHSDNDDDANVASMEVDNDTSMKEDAMAVSGGGDDTGGNCDEDEDEDADGVVVVVVNEETSEVEDHLDHHPLLQFKQHAVESNEIFLIVAIWIARIHRHLAELQQQQHQQPWKKNYNHINGPNNGNFTLTTIPTRTGTTSSTTLDPHHPYVDFCMEPWWDVACLPYRNDSTKQEEATSLEQALRGLCETLHGFLQAAWQVQQRRQAQQEEKEDERTPKEKDSLTTTNTIPHTTNNNENSSNHRRVWSSEWCTPLGMSKLIGSLEQNCMGIRRKHAIRKDIMENVELRHDYHGQLIGCLEQAGFIGEEDDEDNDDKEENGSDCGCDDEACNPKGITEEEKKPSPKIAPPTTLTAATERAITSANLHDTTMNQAAKELETGEETNTRHKFLGENEEWDYTFDEIAGFLAGLSTPLKEGADDEWDALFTPLDGTAMFATACKMNHSCQPNVVLVYKTRGWGRDHPLVAYCLALRDILPGEELTISYIISDDDYPTRQAALVNYGFECRCEKCETEKAAMMTCPVVAQEEEEEEQPLRCPTGKAVLANGGFRCPCNKNCPTENLAMICQLVVQENEKPISGIEGSTTADMENDEENGKGMSDDDEDKEEDDNDEGMSSDKEDIIDQESQEGQDESSKDNMDKGEGHDEELDGETKLQNLVEQMASAENQSDYASIPEQHVAPTVTYAMELAATLCQDFNTVAPATGEDTSISSDRRSTLSNLLEQCMVGLQERDFSLCRIVGGDLESTLYNQWQKESGSWTDTWHARAYLCGSLTAAIGYTQEGSFLVAMKLLDKVVILGQDRGPIAELLAYVELYASQMAAAPCPPALQHRQVLDYTEPALVATLTSQGLSQPMRFPVDEWKGNGSSVHDRLPSKLASHLTPMALRKWATEWPATKKWRDLTRWVQQHGHRLVPINVASTASGKIQFVTLRSFVSSYLVPSVAKVCWSMEDITSAARKCTTINTVPSLANLKQDHSLLDQIDALYDDIEMEPFGGGVGVVLHNVNLSMGTGGTRTPLQWDSHATVLVQLVGAKYVRLYSPDAIPSNELPGNSCPLECEVNDIGLPFTEVLLLPGDGLYIPSHYWQYTRSLSTSVSVSYSYQ
jgi:hypothetical protein